MIRKRFFLYIVIACISVLGTCVAAGAEGARLYSAHNIWYENPQSLWCINYKKGSIIPAGTEVANVALSRAVRGRKAGAELLAISFTTVHDGQKYWVNITKKFHPGKTIHNYKDMMFTEKNIDQLTKGFSKDEIQAVKTGTLVLGMSKPAVIAAYGYPPEHRTPSTKNNTWYYWMNRFRSKAINFDDNGRTFIRTKKKNEL